MIKKLLIGVMMLFAVPAWACTMYKITADGKTIVGNNEDWYNPNAHMWFVPADSDKMGYMCVGFHDHFAQGAINEAGLMFDGFAEPYLEVKNSEGKRNVALDDLMGPIMASFSNVYEVKDYLEEIDLSYLSTSMLVFVDKTGEYLVVEGDEIVIGREAEQSFSNFYPSQHESVEEVELDYYQNGLSYMQEVKPTRSTAYCSEVMNHFQGEYTQYTTIYDLTDLTIEVYSAGEFEHKVELDLMEELSKGERTVVIPALFPEDTKGYQVYAVYNDATKYVDQWRDKWYTHVEGQDEAFVQESKAGFIALLQMTSDDWLYVKQDIDRASTVLGLIVELFPDDPDGYVALADAYNQVDQPEQVLRYCKKALELDPDHELALEMLEQLREQSSE